MNRIVVLLSILIIQSQCFDICQACIKATTLTQNSLIALAPSTPAREIVQAVCQRQYDSKTLCQKVSEQLTPLAIKVGVRAVVKTGPICQSFCPEGFYTRLDLASEVAKIISKTELNDLGQLKPLPVEQKVLKVDRGATRLLHMTDIHLDLNYTQKASIVCDFPICCHAEHGFPETKQTQAPQYGSSKCDAPVKLLDSAIEYIKDSLPKVDAAIITGDFSAHNEWEKTAESVVNMRTLVEGKFDSALNITLITAPGNNEYLPDHQVDPTTYPEQSLTVTDITNTQGETVTFISINTLYCDSINLYLVQDQTMPLRQLKTLDSILAQKQRIFLLAHIDPTSTSCSEVYGTLFRAIITKHSSKIKGQFYGHTHTDSFVVNTDPRDNTTATSFGMLSGSLSPLSTELPRFRVYQINNDFSIVNYNDYAFNLKTNVWALNYNFKQYYGLPLDQPVDAKLMQQLQHKIIDHPQIQLKYRQKAKLITAEKQHVCQTYDNRYRQQLCNNNQTSFRGKIDDLLRIIQGPWGAYGNDIQ